MAGVASAAMGRYRFALRPKWILSHLFVLALVAAMVAAGFWQLQRLQQKKDRNARVAARSAEPVAPVTALSEAGRSYISTDGIEFRRATARGRYLGDQELLVRSRSRDGSPGSWILTPLDLGGGQAVTVNRGWIPNSGELQRVPARYRAPAGTVTVKGLVRQTETRGRFGPRDPSTGSLENLARADVARLDRQVPEALLPLYVQLQEQVPEVGAGDPRPVPAPELDEGPHLSYAVQWFIFTTVALIGYPLILRRRAREVEQEARDDSLDRPDPDDVPAPGDPRLDPGVNARRDPPGA